MESCICSPRLESLGWSKKFANRWLDTLIPQRLYVTGMVGFQRVFEAGSCCSWPAPPALVPFDLDVSVTLCAYSMPKHAQFFYLSLSLPLSFSSLLFLGVCFFLSYMEKIMKVFESKHLCCGYWVWVFSCCLSLYLLQKKKLSSGDAFTKDGDDIVELKIIIIISKTQNRSWQILFLTKVLFHPKIKKERKTEKEFIIFLLRKKHIWKQRCTEILGGKVLNCHENNANK